jgi:hypothetical protein
VASGAAAPSVVPFRASAAAAAAAPFRATPVSAPAVRAALPTAHALVLLPTSLLTAATWLLCIPCWPVPHTFRA